MAMILQDLRNSVRKAVGIPDGDPDLTNTELDLYLNRSYWEVMDEFPFREKERAGAFETVAGTRNYEIPPPVEACQRFAIMDPISFQHKPLDLMNARETEELFIEKESEEGMPQKYLLENCYVRFWPTPDQVYKIEFRKLTILDDIANSGLPIPQVWNEIVIYGANHRIFADLGDLGKANYFELKQVRSLNTKVPRPQKEIIDVEHAGVFPLGRDY